MSKKRRVICDTNIWYGIASGDIKPEMYQDVDLIATGVNIFEFSSTENLLDNHELVKNAIRAMHDHHAEIIEYDPWDYMLAFHVKTEYDSPTRDIYLRDLRAFEALIDNQVEDILSDKTKMLEFEKLIDRINKPNNSFTDKMNEGIIKVREKGVARYGTKRAFIKHMRAKEDSYNEIREMLLGIFASKCQVEPKDLLGKVDWNNIELLFRLWDEYFKEKSLQFGSKFKPNDFYDLTNMAYVEKGDLYWTLEENPWVRLMKFNPVTRKYVYQPKLNE